MFYINHSNCWIWSLKVVVWLLGCEKWLVSWFPLLYGGVTVDRFSWILICSEDFSVWSVWPIKHERQGLFEYHIRCPKRHHVLHNEQRHLPLTLKHRTWKSELKEQSSSGAITKTNATALQQKPKTRAATPQHIHDILLYVFSLVTAAVGNPDFPVKIEISYCSRYDGFLHNNQQVVNSFAFR